MKRNLKELEHRIGYTFQDFALLKKAMSHSSYVNEEHLPKYECNERLEFLGDAVLSQDIFRFLSILHLYHRKKNQILFLCQQLNCKRY